MTSSHADLRNAALYFGSGGLYLIVTACCGMGEWFQTPAISTQHSAAKYSVRGALDELSHRQMQIDEQIPPLVPCDTKERSTRE